ncbi:hypothetical protein ACFQ0B_46770 [Nonomuraea thailandensis]
MQVSTSVVSGGGLQLPVQLFWIQFSNTKSHPDPCSPSIHINDDITEITNEEWA